MLKEKYYTTNKIVSGTDLSIRVAKLESDVHHIRTDITEIKTDIRKFDANLRQLEHKVDANLKWMLSVYGGGFIALFGLMAHGFNWF